MDEEVRVPAKAFSVQGWDIAHYKNTEAYAAMVHKLYDRATKAVAILASKAKIDPNKPFSLNDFPALKKEIQKIVNELSANIHTVITEGTANEWITACKKNDAFLQSILNTSKLTTQQLEKYQSRNIEALNTFQKRKVDGMDLSKRVWKYTGQFKDTMELGIDVGLGEGRSAQQLSQDLRQNLENPDRLFRRVRDKWGNLQLSKAAKALHPGQGTYRSSYKNAMRLTRSEINMAYRQSDQLRWQSLDFVVGFEVRRSNHEYDCEVCDQLKGKYPKSFVFKGWHPQCRCFAIPILMSQEEFNTDELNELKAALKGTEYKKYTSSREVKNYPPGMMQWIKDNKQASRNWQSIPYFVRDNFKGGTLLGGINPVKQSESRVRQVAKEVEQDLLTIIKQKEDIIRKNKSFETAVVFDEKGAILFEKKGQSASVSFEPSETVYFKDSHFTHNHPRGWTAREGSIGRIGNSFSPPDVLIAIKYDMKEVRAVTPLMRFSMKRPARGWPDVNIAYQAIKQIERDVSNENYYRIAAGIITEGQANITHYHTVWKLFAKKFGIKYTKSGD